MAWGLITYHGPPTKEDLADALHDINPVFDDYIVTHDELAKVGDRCRHVWTAQHTKSFNRFAEVVEHTRHEDCATAKVNAIKTLGLRLSGKLSWPDPQKEREALLQEKLDYLL